VTCACVTPGAASPAAHARTPNATHAAAFALPVTRNKRLIITSPLSDWVRAASPGHPVTGALLRRLIRLYQDSAHGPRYPERLSATSRCGMADATVGKGPRACGYR